MMHTYGRNRSSNSSETSVSYREGSDAEPSGSAFQCFSKGVDYELSEGGLPQDSSEAFLWLKKAAEQGMFEAQVNVANMYETGKGVNQDYKKAARWYLAAPEQGAAEAQGKLQGKLGEMYTFGIGVPKDYTAAAKWLRAAAEQGIAASQTNLGFCTTTAMVCLRMRVRQPCGSVVQQTKARYKHS
jgi:hypothetical protein